MANQAERQGEVSESDTMFAIRFFHDVLVYTLRKCGLPESSLPTTDLPENVYHEADFVKVAGASVLRISLVMRDEWKQMFKCQCNNGGFTTQENVMSFLLELEASYISSRRSPTQSFVEVLLASCNEILMYFHLEKINIDFGDVILLVSVCIQSMIGVYENEYVKLEELFDNFDDISGYTEWITDFITKFAIPYGNGDVSVPFIERLRKQYNENPKERKDSLRFLLCNVFLAITNEESGTSSDGESLESPKLPTNSEIGAYGGKKSSVWRSTCTENAFEQSDQSKPSSHITSEVGIGSRFRSIELDSDEDN